MIKRPVIKVSTFELSAKMKTTKYNSVYDQPTTQTGIVMKDLEESKNIQLSYIHIQIYYFL